MQSLTWRCAAAAAESFVKKIAEIWKIMTILLHYIVCDHDWLDESKWGREGDFSLKLTNSERWRFPLVVVQHHTSLESSTT